MTVKEFLEDYKGFDYENGEIVLVDQRKGRQWICTYREGKLKASNPLIDFSRELLIDVYHWTHTEKTMLIVL